MFESRFIGLNPNVGQPMFPLGVSPLAQKNENAPRSPMAVQIDAIYKAAAQRAKEEFEIDRLFNADYYGGNYEI